MAVYGPHLVRDENNAPAQGASGKLYAPTDTSFTTPLTMTALGTGATVVDWVAGSDGQLGTVNVAGVNHPYLWYKPNGGNVAAQQVLSFDSLQGIKDDANASAAAAAASAGEAAATRAEAESIGAQLDAFKAWVDLGVTRYNLATDPHCATYTGSSAGWAYVNGGATATVARNAGTDTPDGRAGYLRATITAATDTGGSSQGPYYRQDSALAGEVGSVVTVSMYVRSSFAINMAARLDLRAAGASTADSLSSSSVFVQANTWTRFSVTLAATAAFDGFQFWVRETAAGSPPVGATLDATMVMLSKGSTLLDYFDGGMTNTDQAGYAWSGAANASVSQMIDMAAISSDLVEAAQAAQAAAEALEAGVADWDAVQNKPGVFPPSPHSHSGSDITSGTVAPQRLGTGARDGSRYLRDDGTWQVPPGAGGGGGGASSWDELLDKPSTFPPSSHSHPASQISDSSPLGRTVLTTSSPITARNAIGAGTSSVTVGGSVTGAAAPATHGHAKGDVGLGNVDNTADADKPVSVAMAAALAMRIPIAPGSPESPTGFWFGTEAEKPATLDPSVLYFTLEEE